MEVSTVTKERDEVLADPDFWVSITEAADRIGVHRKTLMKWCQRGKLGDSARKTPGGLWYVRESWVNEMGRLK